MHTHHTHRPKCAHADRHTHTHTRACSFSPALHHVLHGGVSVGVTPRKHVILTCTCVADRRDKFSNTHKAKQTHDTHTHPHKLIPTRIQTNTPQIVPVYTRRTPLFTPLSRAQNLDTVWSKSDEKLRPTFDVIFGKKGASYTRVMTVHRHNTHNDQYKSILTRTHKA